VKREDLRPYVTMNDGRHPEPHRPYGNGGVDGARGVSVCVWCNHTVKRHGPDGCEGLAEYGGPECGCRRAKTGREAARMLATPPRGVDPPDRGKLPNTTSTDG
jgi:hypothetical protein